MWLILKIQMKDLKMMDLLNQFNNSSSNKCKLKKMKMMLIPMVMKQLNQRKGTISVID